MGRAIAWLQEYYAPDGNAWNDTYHGTCKPGPLCPASSTRIPDLSWKQQGQTKSSAVFNSKTEKQNNGRKITTTLDPSKEQYLIQIELRNGGLCGRALGKS